MSRRLPPSKKPASEYSPFKPMFGHMKICASCKIIGRKTRKHVPCWTCRGCNVKCCEHLCSLKVGTVASCGTCKRNGRVLVSGTVP